MAKSKLSRQRFAALDDDAIRKMKNADLRSILRGARQLYNQTSEVFERNKDKVYSHAYKKMEDYYDDTLTCWDEDGTAIRSQRPTMLHRLITAFF